MLSESSIIQFLQQAVGRLPSEFIGIGDDAAVIPIDDKQSLVITKDVLAEDSHFRRSYASPQDIAHKSLHVNMSDLAAMGTQSQFAFLGLSLPSTLPFQWVQEFLSYFVKSCQSYNILLLGGDTTASQHGVFISVTLMAQVPTIYLKRRTGAKPGDIIALVGALGDAYAGLTLLEEDQPGFSDLKGKALRPQAKVLEGAWFGQQTAVTSMMDISDGLYVDLSRLCQASKVGAEIDLLTLSPSPQLTDACHNFQWDIFKYMLTGGEDYGLLITIDQTHYAQVAQDFYRHFDDHILPIGVIIPEQKVKLIKNGVYHPLRYEPFSHFGEINNH